MTLHIIPEARLQALAEAAQSYVADAFGHQLELAPAAPSSLPHFILDRYQLWQGRLHDRSLVLMAIKEVLPPGSGAMTHYPKHRDQVRRQTGADIVLLLLDRTPNAVRRQMMDRKIGFIAPGAQLYVPEAFLDLRERAPGFAVSHADQISPTTQCLLLGILNRQSLDGLNLTQLADTLSVSVMSISRTLDELEALQLAKPHHVGRQRCLRMLLDGRALWDAVHPSLQNPIRKVRVVNAADPDSFGTLSGESALANYTMLAPPALPTRAVLAAAWKRLALATEVKLATPFDEHRVEIQTWTYDPQLLAEGGVVDRLSLYLTFRESADERVAQAADELLETFPW
jgi:DNA-binding MarR family transcriptional regulator